MYESYTKSIINLIKEYIRRKNLNVVLSDNVDIDDPVPLLREILMIFSHILLEIDKNEELKAQYKKSIEKKSIEELLSSFIS